MTLYKLGVEDGTEEYVHLATYVVQNRETPGERIFAGLPHGNPAVFEDLILALKPPFFLLYVLHTTRGEGEEGRYQSPELSLAQILGFMQTFAGYIPADSRFDLWVRSITDNATLVWDRHNLLFGYGPTDRFEAVLKTHGFVLGEPGIPFPHTHHYRVECDDDAQRVLSYFDWYRTPLRPEDEQ